MDLADCLFCLWHMHETSPCADEIETVIRKGEALCIGFHDVSVKSVQTEPLLREFHCFGGEIDRRNVGAHPDELLGEHACAAGDIEHLLPLESLHVHEAREEGVTAILCKGNPLQELAIDIAKEFPGA